MSSSVNVSANSSASSFFSTSFRAASTTRAWATIFNTSLSSSCNASVYVSVWQRQSASVVNVTRVIEFRYNESIWAAAPDTLLPSDMLNGSYLANYTTRAGDMFDSAAHPRSSLLNILLVSTERYALQLNAVDGSLRGLFPLTERALAQSSSILADGLYLDVVIHGRSAGAGNSTVYTSAVPPPTLRGDVWQAVATSSCLSVLQLLTGSNSQLDEVPAAIGLFNPDKRVLVGCGDVHCSATTCAAGGYIDQPVQVARYGTPPSLAAAAAALSNVAQNPVEQCRSIFQFVAAHDITSTSILMSSTTAAGYYLSTYPLTALRLTAAANNAAEWRSVPPEIAAGSGYVVIVMTAKGSTETSITRTRGQIAVVAFVVAVGTVFLLVLTIRLMTRPLHSITRAVQACVTLDLHRMTMMEASLISEIADIQRSLSYLAIRLYHYLKFLPDKRVLQRILTLSSSSDDDSSEVDTDIGEGDSDDERSGGATNKDKTSRGTIRLDIINGETQITDEREQVLESRLHQHRRMKPLKAPVNSILVEVVYESRHLNRNRVDRSKIPSKTATFVFRHRVTDPVLANLTRQSRTHLSEHPGEVLVLFTSGGAGVDGLRQLTSDEDVLFAIENSRAQRNLMPEAAKASSGKSSDLPENEVQLPVLRLCVRKGSTRELLPLLIALGTLLTVLTRFILSVQRMSSQEHNTQLLGLLLLGCLAVQIAQNALISLYLVRRFSVLDKDFKAWAEVSTLDVAVGVAFGSLNVTNLEILGCYVRIGKMRLSAPIAPWLRVKISKYSFVGFIVGDLLPFVFIMINIVLSQAYRDPLVMLSVAFSVLSVLSILISHGILRFVVSETTAARKPNSGSPAGGSGAGGTVSVGGIGVNRSLLLSKRDITVVHVSITEQDVLVDFLSIPLVDLLLEKLYDAVQAQVQDFGGLLLEAQGLTSVIVFNAHAVVPNHTKIGLQFFCKLRDDLERNVLPQFFTGDKFRAHVVSTMPSSQRRQPTEVSKRIYNIHGMHRVVASIVTDEMAMGYVGTLTAQTFQRVGYHAYVCRALCDLNELYGSTLLTTAATAHHLQLDRVLMRKIDEFSLSNELHLSSEHDAMLRPYASEEKPTVGHTPQSPQIDTRIMAVARAGAAQMAPWLLSPEAPRVAVCELIIHGFLPQSTAGCAGIDNANDGQRTTSSTSTHLPHHQLRCRPRTAKTSDALREWTDAVDIFNSMQNDGPMQKYMESHPDDHVAKAMMRWQRFMFAHNKAAAISVPRVLSTLGVSRHPCETPDGRELEPVTTVLEADVTLAEAQQRLQQRYQRLRPPRSERRAKASLGGLAMSGAANAVIEKVLSAQTGYNVTFQSPETLL